MNNDDKDALILFEDERFRFVICQYDKSHIFFIRVKSNPLASAWKVFETELEAIRYAENHILTYQKEAA